MTNNYIAIDFNGEQVGLKFGFPQAKAFAVSLVENLDVYFDGDSISSTGISKLLQTAYNNNCLLKEVKPSLTFEQFSNWVDDAIGNEERQKVIAECLIVWQESEYTKSWIDNVKKNVQAILLKDEPQTKQKKSTKKSKRVSMQAESQAGS